MLAAVVLIGGGPGVEDVAAAAERPPTAAVGPVAAEATLLGERVENVRFPNYVGPVRWKAAGTRTDEIDGRRTRTVFYERGDMRIAYTVVAGEALAWPEEGADANRGGTRLRAFRVGDRDVVTWRKQGQTCVISAKGVPRDVLLKLAVWKGKGAGAS